jgi:ATP synthase protein I
MISVMPNTDSHRNDGDGNYARLFGVGFAFIVIIGVLTALGYFVDRILGTLPLFLIVGLGLGFAGALYNVYRALKTLGGG